MNVEKGILKEQLSKYLSPMRYLITTKEVKSPFLTDWVDPENHFIPDSEMVVYDLLKKEFTTDGETWHEIEIDYW